DELGKLGHAFNDMAANLQQMIADRVSKEYLETMVTTYRNFVTDVTNGDLQGRLKLNDNESQDDDNDLYQLGSNLNGMAEGLTLLTRRISDSAKGLSEASAEILAATTQQIASATEQDATVTQTMTTVEEVRQTVRQTS